MGVKRYSVEEDKDHPRHKSQRKNGEGTEKGTKLHKRKTETYTEGWEKRNSNTDPANETS